MKTELEIQRAALIVESPPIIDSLVVVLNTIGVELNFLTQCPFPAQRQHTFLLCLYFISG